MLCQNSFLFRVFFSFLGHTWFIIDREAREIIRLVASVRPSVRLCVCLRSNFWTITHGKSPWHMEYSPRSLHVFVNNQETFAIKSCAQRSGAFNSLDGGLLISLVWFSIRKMFCKSVVRIKVTSKPECNFCILSDLKSVHRSPCHPRNQLIVDFLFFLRWLHAHFSRQTAPPSQPYHSIINLEQNVVSRQKTAQLCTYYW